MFIFPARSSGGGRNDNTEFIKTQKNAPNIKYGVAKFKISVV
jgi:hypothetical protein